MRDDNLWILSKIKIFIKIIYLYLIEDMLTKICLNLWIKTIYCFYVDCDTISDIVDEYEYKLRIIKYIINGKPYYVASNILDYSKQMIQNLYHDRWTIEEYFKYIKQYMKLSKMNEKREEDITKTIISQLIVSQITFLIVNLNKQKDNKHVVNKSILTDGIYDKYLYYFFNNIKFTKYFILNFIKIYIKIILSNKGKSFEHVCKRANYKWYFKKHFENVKSKST